MESIIINVFVLMVGKELIVKQTSTNVCKIHVLMEHAPTPMDPMNVIVCQAYAVKTAI